MIKTVDNFDSSFVNRVEKSTGFEFINPGNSLYFVESTRAENDLYIDLKSYNNQSNDLLSIFKLQSISKQPADIDDLIISIQNSNNDYTVKTGNYVGLFSWGNNLEINIGSRFGNVFLTRMLNFANDIFLDDVNVAGDLDKKSKLDISRFIIFYMFVQRLEKAFLLGLPKTYQSIRHHEIMLKGKIDINRFVKRDIPFKGKISSVSREQREIPEIIDVLFKAVKILDNFGFPTQHILNIKSHLKQQFSGKYVSNHVITKARESKALQNPIFAPYKKVLEYAEIIIKGDNIKPKADGKKESFGYLINIAELFEIYITKLLQKEFPDWSVESPHIALYDNQFYKRKIIPDIVMQKGNQVMVFDTKYKRMNFKGTEHGNWDVDRNDFFQIHTYASYYQNSNTHLICAGLLYPLQGKPDSQNCVSDNLLGNTGCKFIVDGIDLSFLNNTTQKNSLSMLNIKNSEMEFIRRIHEIINSSNQS